MTRRFFIVAAVVLACIPRSAWSADPALVVIVHPSRTVSLNRDDLANIFLKRRRFWDDGAPIAPVNREAESDARERFSRAVLGAASSAFATYWNAAYFHGTFPPITLSSSGAVKRYVATEVNAIGYIVADEVDETVRVVLRFD